MPLWQLAKRTAIVLCQATKDCLPQRRPPITPSHMTNTLVVPVLGFINCTKDWERRYGYEDFQDRFSPELTVAETIGRQAGAWPTILAGGHLDLRVPLMYRRRFGAAPVHEPQVFDYRPEWEAELYRWLFEFGYGTPRRRLFDYWQTGHPVKVEGVAARWR